jgi:hypothetical protein
MIWQGLLLLCQLLLPWCLWMLMGHHPLGLGAALLLPATARVLSNEVVLVSSWLHKDCNAPECYAVGQHSNLQRDKMRTVCCAQTVIQYVICCCTCSHLLLWCLLCGTLLQTFQFALGLRILLFHILYNMSRT